jgi:hypothetical protein
MFWALKNVRADLHLFPHFLTQAPKRTALKNILQTFVNSSHWLVGGGIGVGVIYSYNYTAECKTSPQTEVADGGGKPREATLEDIIDKARDVVQRVKVNHTKLLVL